MDDPRIAALPDSHGHVKGEHKPFAEERPIPYTARMLFLWFYHACRRGAPRFMMVADHVNYLTFEDPAATNLVRRALKLAQAGDLYGAAETAGVEINHAAVVSEGLRRGMRCSIGAEVDNDSRNRPDAQNIVDAMRPDGILRAVHFLPITHPQYGENWQWPFNDPEFKELFDVIGVQRAWEIYMATLLEAIEKLPGHIVAHFYAPAKFGHWPDDAVLERYEDQLVDACAARGMAIEINARFFYRYFADDDVARARYRAANLRLARKAKDKGVMIAVGSSAHSPKDQGAAFETVLGILDEADINEIAFPIEGRLARVALRATEEHIRHLSGYATDRDAVPEPAAAASEAPGVTVLREAAPEHTPDSNVEAARPPRPRRKETRRPTPRRQTADPIPAVRPAPVAAAVPDASMPTGPAGPQAGRSRKAAALPDAPAAAPRATSRRNSQRKATKPAAKRTTAKAKAPQHKAATARSRGKRTTKASSQRTRAKKTPPASKKAAAKRLTGPPARKSSSKRGSAKRAVVRKGTKKVAKRPVAGKRSGSSKKASQKKTVAKKKTVRSRRR